MNVTRIDDAKRAVDAGVTAISVSNHGGNTLYAVIPAAYEVAAFNTKTLNETALYKFSAGDAITGLAFQADKIWVSYTTLSSITGAIRLLHGRQH